MLPGVDKYDGFFIAGTGEEKNMIDIKSLTLRRTDTEEMETIGEKKFRAGQIYELDACERLVDSFDEMTNLSKGLREKLKEQYELTIIGAGGSTDIEDR